MYEGLNSLQKEALDEDENTLLLACPGSGKTHVLTLKIAKELEKLKNRTDRIAALTFTNRAADEIDTRIDGIGVDISQLWTGTIHSFCLQWIIKPYGVYLPELQNGYSILDEFKTSILKEGFKEQFNIPRFNEFVTRKDRQGNYLNDQGNMNEAAKAYHKHLLNNNLIDFDLILYFSYILLIKYPKIPNKLSRIFRYLFIDEFQDTQDLQYAIVGQILRASQGRSKIFLVGDPDQAIFESLGGTVKTSAEIKEEIGGYNINELKLSGNYRSTQRLIDLYSNFQSSNLLIESLADYKEENGFISLDRYIHKDALVVRIAEIVQEQISKGVPPCEICILAPQWNMLTSMARKLKSELPNIEFDSPGLTILPRNPENILYKLTRIILISNEPNKHVIRMKWAREILIELSVFNSDIAYVNSESTRKFLKIINSINVLKEDTIEFLEESFNNIFRKIGLDFTDNDILSEQWDNFFAGLKRRYERSDFSNVPKDIYYTKKMFNTREGVVINTCQGVKGEEFHTVIAFGLLRGYIPHWSQIIKQPTDKEVEAANKLLYVICSRAKKELFLFAEKERYTRNGREYEECRQLAKMEFGDC